MPPKAKFTQEQIVDAALRIVENEGLQYLTARNLGEKLGSSARPIFTAFANMDDVLNLSIKKADEIYTDYIAKGLKEVLPFKGVGVAYIRFATERPKLFQLLFMKEKVETPDIKSVLRGIETSYDRILASICENYAVDVETAKKLYLHIWIYSHGIAVLTATKVCAFTAEQVSQMLTDVFTSLLIRAKKGELK